ncbi:response regulator [Micromonospora sp. LOL_021]|uniref:response regulator n=1 Tax=Micromonospora sp. LOL_021 TaxID=3345417 RepID=UPI003A899A11
MTGDPGTGAAVAGDAAIRVVLVDDQALVRAGFRMVLDYSGDMTVVGEAGDGAEALRLLRTVETDVVVMDVRMPVLDGVEATRRICAAGPTPRVLVLTTFDTEADAFAALQAGASGFLLKSVPPEDLLAAIRVIAAGDSVVAPRITRRLLDRFAGQLVAAGPATPAVDGLTDREREVLLLVGQGLSNAEIAGRLTVAEATVKTHVGRILAKLGLRDRVQAVVLAYETGLIRPGTTT